MRAAYWVWRRELHVMLRAPIVYLVGGLFLVVQGIAFAGLVGALSDPRKPAPLGALLEGQLSGTLLTWVLQLVVLTLLGMRTIADDKRSGAWELLLTAQVSERAAVVDKWLAAATVYALLWIPTLAYLGVVAAFRADAGGFDLAQIAVGYLGAIALGAALLAWTVAASAATSSTLTAGALGFGLLIVVFLAGELPALWPDLAADYPGLASTLAAISLRGQLGTLARGEVATGTLVVIAGLAVVGLSLAIAFACAGRRRQREVRIRASATLACAAITIALAVLAIRHPMRLDVSADRRNSLDPQTREVLGRVPAASLVIIEPTIGGLAPIYDEVARVAARMAEVAPQVTVRRVDPARAPGGLAAVARAAGLQATDLASGGAVIVDVGPRRRVVDLLALASIGRGVGDAPTIERLAIEQALTGAVAELARDAPITACLTTGHGELPAAGATNDQDWRLVTDRLRGEGITIEELGPGESAIPERCTVVLVAGPTTPLTAGEALAIQRHVASGRGLLVAAASRPGTGGGLVPTGLEAVLASDGLGLPLAIAIDPTLAVRELPGALLVVTGYTDHPISAGFANARATLWFQPRPVIVDSKSGARPLILASAASWGERDLVTNPPAKDQDDLAGPVILAALGARHHVLAIGSAESLSTAMLTGGASASDLWLARAVRELAGLRTSPVDIAARAPEQVRLVMTDGERRIVLGLCIGGIPLAWAALGGLVVWLRRRRMTVTADLSRRDGSERS